MAKGEKPVFSKHTLRAAKHIQRLLGKKGAPIVGLFTGSRSPAYHQLEWFATDIPPNTIATVKADGDSEAGYFARKWDRSIVMGVGQKALDFAIACHDDGQQAVAFVSQDVVHVGLLPEGVNFGTELNMRTAAMRQGRKPIEAAMGLWIPDGKLIVPTDLSLLDELVPNMALHRIRHDTPLF